MVRVRVKVRVRVRVRGRGPACLLYGHSRFVIAAVVSSRDMSVVMVVVVLWL